MFERELQFESPAGTPRCLRFTQKALLDLEAAGILPDEFYEATRAPSKLQKALHIGLEGARRYHSPASPPVPEGVAEAILEDLGNLQTRVTVAKAWNRANSIPDATPDSPGVPAAGATEPPKA